MKIVWQSPARLKLQQIMDYIAEDSRPTALKYGNEIYQRVNDLLKFPETGVAFEVKNGKIIRKIIIGKTISVIYRISKTKIYILSLQDNRQNWKK